VGHRRFKPPMPVTAFGELDACCFKPVCPQVPFYGDSANKFTGDEDCLHLNIFSPSLTQSKDALKPVMIWIHGGGYIFGSGNEYIPIALLKKDVVVVTINYRLAVMGYLTFANDIVSGNMGLRDQLEAIKWVKRFIHNFGGDPNKITIFGESAGGSSVHAIHMSPKSKGLISGAIAQSGTMLMRRTTQEAAHEERNAMRIAQKFNCSSLQYDDAMLQCLQEVSAEDLFMSSMYVGHRTDVSRVDRERSHWWPIVDAYSSDPVLPVDPLTAMKTGMFNKAPLMSGTIKNEGALHVVGLITPGSGDKQGFWKYIAAQQLMLTESANVTETSMDEFKLAQVATQYYTDWNFHLMKKGQEWMDLFTDALFLSPDQKVMQAVTDQGNVAYNYVFNYAPNNTMAKVIGVPDNSISPVQGEDVTHLFEHVAGVNIQTDEEQTVSAIMIEYWTNFAKYGNPSPFTDTDLPQWKPYSNEKNYLEIKPVPEMKSDIHPERMFFWQKMLWDKREDAVDRLMLYNKLTKLFIGLKPGSGRVSGYGPPMNLS